MTWTPEGITAHLSARASFSLGDLEQDYPTCPARAGIKARRGWVDGCPPQSPFEGTLTAMFRDVVLALVVGRNDADGGLARAEATYRNRHPMLRSFLDAAALNYLEFIEAREAEVGSLTYVDYSFRRDIDARVSLKLWAPVYETPAGVREVHRLRNGAAKINTEIWATGAAWVAGDGRRPATVVEVGLGTATDALIREAVPPRAVQDDMDRDILDKLTDLRMASNLVPGPHCVSCDAVAVCPALIPLNVFDGQADATPWVRGVSQTELVRYRACPAKAFARSMNLPADLVSSEAMDRGVRVHSWIAASHSGEMPCSDALLLKGTGVEEDEPYLAAHVANCDRRSVSSIALDQTLVGWDASAGDVVFLKPDEVFFRGDVLVLRETKTTTAASALEGRNALELYADVVSWWLAVLNGGLSSHFNARAAVLELEILTPGGGVIYPISVTEPSARLRVAGWRLDTPALWLQDRDFLAQPGAQCAQCEVLRWCTEGQSIS